jgi:PKD repeat protein
MKAKLILILLVSSIGIINSQKISGSKIRFIEKAAEINTLDELDIQWDVQLRSLEASANRGPIPEKELEKIRSEAREEPAQKSKGLRTTKLAPNLGLKFESNRSNGSVPPDNAIAVSGKGHVISCVNSNIWIGRADGKLDKSSSMADFFKKLQLGGGYFDPRVVFDYKHKRFIIVCLSGNTPTTSYVAIAASKAEDPNLGFNFYKIKGDLLDDGLWFDYPGVGMTRDELFINGNMFTPTEPGSFRYSTIYQIDKKSMYEGLPLKMKDFPKLTNLSGGILFNCTPTIHIDTMDTENVAHFFSSRSGGSNSITYSRIVGKLDQNSSYEAVRNITTEPYQIAPLASMRNNEDKLRTNDCRIQHCLKQGNTINFVFTSRVDTFSGIYIGRYDIETGEIFTYKFQDSSFFAAYPSIAYLGNVEGQETYLVHYLRSNEEEFPEMAAITVGGSRDEFFVSPIQLLRKGETAVTALTGNERWGDYTTACTRYNPNGGIEVWVNGSYGRPSFASFTAQVLHPDSLYTDFFPSTSVGVPGDIITLNPITTDTLTDISFTIDGAKEVSENGKSRFLFEELGSYSGKMIALNSRGEKVSIEKADIITIRPKVLIPETEFIADKVVIFEGDTVQFQDISKNKPDEWKWLISGAEPSVSSDQNPTAIYKRKGVFNVLLNAGNEAGAVTKLKTRFITVKQRPALPVVSFTSDKKTATVNDTIAFYDQSENSPFAWKWQFINKTDTLTSTSQNPLMSFTRPGNYTVNLAATNEVGTSEMKIDDFFNIIILLDSDDQLIEKATLYPNPSFDKVHLKFHSPQLQFLKYEIYDLQGKLVKNLIEKNVGSGENELSFSVEPLPAGRYTLRIVSDVKNQVQSFNFIVQK